MSEVFAAPSLTFRGFLPGTESLSSSATTFCESPNREAELTIVAAASEVRTVKSFMMAAAEIEGSSVRMI